MGVEVEIGHNTGYPVGSPPALVLYGLADGIVLTEIAAGHALGQDHGVDLSQGGLGIPLEEFQIEHIDRAGIGVEASLFFESLGEAVGRDVGQDVRV